MALSDPRIVYGVHSFSPYDRTSREFFGTVKVVGNSSLNLSGELVRVNGGSARFPFAIEDGLITAELSLLVREFPDFLFELFLGKSPTANAAEATGNVTTLTNRQGTSVQDASTGIASVAAVASDEADLKFAKYVVKAVSSTTVDVFASSDVDFARGTDTEFEDDLLKINASPLTITMSATTALADYGLEFTGGSGTIGMTTGDTATFEVRPINNGSMDVTIGGTTDVYPEFGAILMAQQRGNGEMFEIDMFRVKGIGLPLPLAEKAFAEAEITAEGFFDSARGGVFSIRHVEPT